MSLSTIDFIPSFINPLLSVRTSHNLTKVNHIFSNQPIVIFMFLKKYNMIILKCISPFFSRSSLWRFLRLLILNYKWGLKRNLSVVLSLNAVRKNIIISHRICFLNNSKYKELSIINNMLFFKVNIHVSFPSKLNFLKGSCILISKKDLIVGL